MNAVSLSTLEGQRNHYAAIRARLMGAPPPVKRVSPVMDLPAFLHLVPLWKKEHLFFDAHVYAWREELMARASPLRAYIKRRANEMGFTYEDMVKKGRQYEKVSVRHLIMWEIKRLVKPEISYPEIGRLFGGFDHTSVMSAVRKIDRQKASQLAG